MRFKFYIYFHNYFGIDIPRIIDEVNKITAKYFYYLIRQTMFQEIDIF